LIYFDDMVLKSFKNPLVKFKVEDYSSIWITWAEKFYQDSKDLNYFHLMD